MSRNKLIWHPGFVFTCYSCPLLCPQLVLHRASCGPEGWGSVGGAAGWVSARDCHSRLVGDEHPIFAVWHCWYHHCLLGWHAWACNLAECAFYSKIVSCQSGDSIYHCTPCKSKVTNTTAFNICSRFNNALESLYHVNIIVSIFWCASTVLSSFPNQIPKRLFWIDIWRLCRSFDNSELNAQGTFQNSKLLEFCRKVHYPARRGHQEMIHCRHVYMQWAAAMLLARYIFVLNAVKQVFLTEKGRKFRYFLFIERTKRSRLYLHY